MILVGENLNIMSKTLGPALKERNAGPVIEMAKAENKADVDYLDLNIGPARKAGDEFMTWVVKTVQEVTLKPLSLDTTNPIAMEAGLKVCRSKALVNSISLQPDRLQAELPLQIRFHTGQRSPDLSLSGFVGPLRARVRVHRAAGQGRSVRGFPRPAGPLTYPWRSP